MEITLIAALNNAYTIGINQSLPWHLPKDLKFFMDTTKHHTIIMGRKTFESIGKPLPHRRNIVITSQKLTFDGIEVFGSLTSALNACKDEKEVFITGGSRIYQEALPIATKMHLTFVDSWDEGDTYVPHFNPHHWTRASIQYFEKDDKHAFDFSFQTFIKKKVY